MNIALMAVYGLALFYGGITVGIWIAEARRLSRFERQRPLDQKRADTRASELRRHHRLRTLMGK